MSEVEEHLITPCINHPLLLRRRIIMGITRRDFLKATAATVATAAIGRSVIGRNTSPNDFSLTEQFDLIETALAEEAGRDITIVSDVDGHSQCMMSVSVEDGTVTEIRGNPAVTNKPQQMAIDKARERGAKPGIFMEYASKMEAST